MSARKDKLYFSLIIHIFFAFTIIVFGPYEIFISNSNDFSFTFRDFWWMPVIVAVLYVIIASLICTLLPKCFGNIIHLLVFSFTLCCYVQAMFLNSQMKVLVGKDIHWSRSTIIINAAVWFLVFGGIFVLKHFAKDIWQKLLQFLALALTIMQLVALVFLLTTTDALTEEKTGYLSQKGMLELSKEKNVVVFILDYFDGSFMDSILAENPDILQPLDGFTYFPNATSVTAEPILLFPIC